MDTSSHIDPSITKELHLDILPDVTRKAFLKCATNPLFAGGGWYLAG